MRAFGRRKAYNAVVMAVPAELVTAVLLVAVGWAVLVALALWLTGVQPRRGSFEASALLRLIQVYCRAVHRLQVSGLEHVPQPARTRADVTEVGAMGAVEGERSGGGGGSGDRASEGRAGEGRRGLIVVANHTAGVDPLLIQAALDRMEPRWMMAEDMRHPALEWLWRFASIIFVDRAKPGHAGLNEAIGHLRSGGTLGLFPEGRIERPERTILPFQPGLGVLVRKTGARVLPVIVRGTPGGPTAWSSLLRRSRSSVEFLPVLDFAEAGGGKVRTPAAEITGELRETFRRHSGWPLNDDPEPLPWDVGSGDAGEADASS